MIIFLLLFAFANAVHAYEQIPMGNFALAISQRPRPLFSFGQTIVERGDFLISDTITFLPGKRRAEFVNALTFLYGFTDYFHAYFQIPAPVYRKVDTTKATKCGDINIFAEYQFFQRETPVSATKATIYANIFMPSGILVEPSPVNFSRLAIIYNFTAFLFGALWCHTTIDWYCFAAFANLFPIKKDHIKLGQNFFFQSGIGHNLGIYDDKILFLLLEFYIVRNQHNRIHGLRDKNSGGLTLFLGPSFWYSTERIIFQAGVDIPVYQRLHGNQPKSTAFGCMALTWKF